MAYPFSRSIPGLIRRASNHGTGRNPRLRSLIRNPLIPESETPASADSTCPLVGSPPGTRKSASGEIPGCSPTGGLSEAGESCLVLLLLYSGPCGHNHAKVSQDVRQNGNGEAPGARRHELPCDRCRQENGETDCQPNRCQK